MKLYLFLQNSIYKRRSTKRGFTLIELLIVIAILGLLSGLVTILTAGSTRKARNVSAQSNILTFGKAMETFKIDNDAGVVPIVQYPINYTYCSPAQLPVSSLSNWQTNPPGPFSGIRSFNGLIRRGAICAPPVGANSVEDMEMYGIFRMIGFAYKIERNTYRYVYTTRDCSSDGIGDTTTYADDISADHKLSRYSDYFIYTMLDPDINGYSTQVFYVQNGSSGTASPANWNNLLPPFPDYTSYPLPPGNVIYPICMPNYP